MFVGRDPLTSDTRRRIYEHVVKRPGLHLRAVARGVDLDTNHTKYHLTYLEQHGLVTSERVHGYWAFFPANGGFVDELGDLGSSEKAQLFLIRKEVPRRVVTKLMEVGEANHKILQEAAGVSASTLYYHLRRMAGKEVVTSRKQGPARLWRLTSPQMTRRLLEISSPQWRPEEEVVRYEKDTLQDEEQETEVVAEERWSHIPVAREINN